MTDQLPALNKQDISSSITEVRGKRVILDSDLAAYYGIETKRLNEQISRNSDKFSDKYVFQLTKEEHDALKSQSATSNAGRGGRRTLPWAFTEHGVVMAATVTNSKRAFQVSELIVDVFVYVLKQNRLESGDRALPAQTLPIPPDGLQAKLRNAIDSVLDSMVNPARQTTVRKETHEFIDSTISNLKERLKKSGLENEVLKAKAAKLIAEAEKARAETYKTEAETRELELSNMLKELRFLYKAYEMMEQRNPKSFIQMLNELSAGDTEGE